MLLLVCYSYPPPPDTTQRVNSGGVEHYFSIVAAECQFSFPPTLNIGLSWLGKFKSKLLKSNGKELFLNPFGFLFIFWMDSKKITFYFKKRFQNFRNLLIEKLLDGKF